MTDASCSCKSGFTSGSSDLIRPATHGACRCSERDDMWNDDHDSFLSATNGFWTGGKVQLCIQRCLQSSHLSAEAQMIAHVTLI